MRKRIFAVLFVILLILSVSVGGFQISKSRTFQFFGGIVQTVNMQEKSVALTFDDGPTDKTDIILKILKDCDIKATFFLIGDNIEKNPEEAKKIAESGHEIGNHTYSHNRMVLKSPSYIKEEIEKTDGLIRNSGYSGTIQFRPPYGKKLILLPYYLKQQGRRTVMWDIEPETYPEIASSSEKIVKHVIDNVKPGSIILLHPMYDGKGNTINAIKGIVAELEKKGYTFKTVSELMAGEN